MYCLKNRKSWCDKTLIQRGNLLCRRKNSRIYTFLRTKSFFFSLCWDFSPNLLRCWPHIWILYTRQTLFTEGRLLQVHLLMWRHRQFIWQFFVFLVNFSYWCKFHVNIITGSEVMTIFFYEGLTRNLEIRNILVWVFLNIWRLGKANNIKFGTNISNEMLLNAPKFQGYSFYRFCVIKVKPTVG